MTTAVVNTRQTTGTMRCSSCMRTMMASSMIRAGNEVDMDDINEPLEIGARKREARQACGRGQEEARRPRRRRAQAAAQARRGPRGAPRLRRLRRVRAPRPLRRTTSARPRRWSGRLSSWSATSTACARVATPLRARPSSASARSRTASARRARPWRGRGGAQAGLLQGGPAARSQKLDRTEQELQTAEEKVSKLKQQNSTTPTSSTRPSAILTTKQREYEEANAEVQKAEAKLRARRQDRAGRDQGCGGDREGRGPREGQAGDGGAARREQAHAAGAHRPRGGGGRAHDGHARARGRGRTRDEDARKDALDVFEAPLKSLLEA